MPQGDFHVAQNNFAAGELSPLMDARADFDRYNAGAVTCENWFVLPTGGIQTMWGSTFVAEVKESAKITRVRQFEFSTTQAYVLEFGEAYMRVYRNNGQVGAVITDCVSGIASRIRVTSVGHTLVTGDTLFISDVLGTTEANGFWTITRIDDDKFELNGSTFVTAYISGGTWRIEIITPWAQEDLRQLKFVQSADLLYVFNEFYQTRRISRTSHTTWTLAAVDFVDGPYRTQPVGEVRTITPSAVSGSITLTASSALFSPNHVGALWEITHVGPAVTGHVKITAFASSTSVTATVLDILGDTIATGVWREGMWNTQHGFPNAATIHEERLIAGGSPGDPAIFAGSRSGSYEDMTDGTEDDDSFVYQIGGDKVPTILWFAALDSLIIGTAGGEFKVIGGQESGLTPTNVFVRRQTAHGSKNISPVEVENSALFIQKGGRKMRRLAFAPEADAFTAEDMTLLSDHITKTGLGELSFHAEPLGLVWAIRGDGQMVVLTTLESQKVRAFARKKSLAHTAGAIDVFESVTSIPHPDGDRDQTWVVVKRELPSGSVRYIERIDDTATLDSSLNFTGAPTNSVTGLAHLEGRTVGIVGDGAVYPTEVVSSGTVTLEGNAASVIDVGIVFRGLLKTMKPEVNLGDGTSQGRTRKWINARISFFEALGVTFRTSEQDQGDTLEFRAGNDPMDAPPPIFTGFKKVSTAGWDDAGQLILEQNEPVKATVLGVFGKISVGDI